ncbi:MAG TPA: hypothetical protein VMQ60_01625 [Acidobacteriaceae bacterium]|nr:hypothetical protein [Acidobacteriaceae bacterium]
MKDRIPKSEKEQKQAAARVRGKFIPCERETGGGAQKPGNGTTCCGGQMFFWASYQGKLERYAKDCQCLTAWRAGYSQPEPGKKPQPVLIGSDHKAKAAGE